MSAYTFVGTNAPDGSLEAEVVDAQNRIVIARIFEDAQLVSDPTAFLKRSLAHAPSSLRYSALYAHGRCMVCHELDEDCPYNGDCGEMQRIYRDHHREQMRDIALDDEYE